MGFGLGGKRARDGLLGVSLADGVSVALVDRPRGGLPRLVEHAWFGAEAEREPRRLRGELQRLKLARTATVVLLEPDQYQLLLVEAPRVEPAELRAAIRWRVKDLVDFHIDDAVFDVFEIPGQRATAQRQSMMYAVVARTAAVRRRVDHLQNAGLEMRVVDIPEMSLRNLAALTDEDVHGVVLLHLSEHGGMLTLSRQHHLYLTRRIETGSAALRGADEPARAELLDGIVLEIQRSIDYYDRHFGQPPLAGVVVVPPGPGLDGIEAHLDARLGLPVRRLDLNRVLDAARPMDEAEQARCALAIGAALRHEEAVL